MSSDPAQAMRYNDGKPELHRILQFGSALEKLAKVMELGAVKYEDGNWLKGGKDDREYLDSLSRHLMSFVNAQTDVEEYDYDSGCHHLAHVAWNALALLRLNRDDQDDLDPTFDIDAFYERWGS